VTFRRIAASAALCALGALCVAACGSDVPAPRSRPKIVVLARDDSFVVPSLLPSGWVDITLNNAGRHIHELAFVKLGGMSFAEFEQRAAREDFEDLPPDTVFVGGPGNAGPGTLSPASVELAPGAYGVACFVRDPGDERSHAAKGMVASVEVEPSVLTSDAAPTAESGTIELRDSDFVLPPGFKGAGTVAVTNASNQVHGISIFKVAPGRGIGDVRNYLLAQGAAPRGRAPFQSVGGVAALGPGRTAFVPLLLGPGEYVLADLLRDPATGATYARQGMIEAISIS
jgi:hypothetical protein